MLVVNDYIYFTTNVFRIPFPYWYAMHAFELNAILTENCCVFVMHLNSRFPFDWGIPHGYLMAFILIYITQLNWIFFVRCSLCFGIGVYMFIIALTKDITADLEFLRDITISHHCQSQHLSYSLLSFYCSFRHESFVWTLRPIKYWIRSWYQGFVRSKNRLVFISPRDAAIVAHNSGECTTTGWISMFWKYFM